MRNIDFYFCTDFNSNFMLGFIFELIFKLFGVLRENRCIPYLFYVQKNYIFKKQ